MFSEREIVDHSEESTFQDKKNLPAGELQMRRSCVKVFRVVSEVNEVICQVFEYSSGKSVS